MICPIKAKNTSLMQAFTKTIFKGEPFNCVVLKREYRTEHVRVTLMKVKQVFITNQKLFCTTEKTFWRTCSIYMQLSNRVSFVISMLQSSLRVMVCTQIEESEKVITSLCSCPLDRSLCSYEI